jgi:hypothetical protein
VQCRPYDQAPSQRRLSRHQDSFLASGNLHDMDGCADYVGGALFWPLVLVGMVYLAELTTSLAVSAERARRAFSAASRNPSRPQPKETGNETRFSGSSSHTKTTKERLRVKSCVNARNGNAGNGFACHY